MNLKGYMITTFLLLSSTSSYACGLFMMGKYSCYSDPANTNLVLEIEISSDVEVNGKQGFMLHEKVVGQKPKLRALSKGEVSTPVSERQKEIMRSNVEYQLDNGRTRTAETEVSFHKLKCGINSMEITRQLHVVFGQKTNNGNVIEEFESDIVHAIKRKSITSAMEMTINETHSRAGVSQKLPEQKLFCQPIL